MKKRTLALVSGVLLAAGGMAAIAAPPHGHMGAESEMDMMGPDGAPPRGGMHRGMGGWFGPRSVTADQYDTRTRERFARFDRNGDGVLDSSEIEALLMSSGPRGRSANSGRSEFGETLLQRFGDKDGKISKDSFLAEAKRRFTQFDLNNDGKITDDDLPPMLRGKGLLKASGPNVPGPMGGMLTGLRRADTKQDGVITQDAFLAAESKRFDEFDRNNDGVIDKSDFDLMRKDTIAYGVKRFLHTYGADADGKITKDQFYKVAKERFARLDRKGEGKITLGEMMPDGKGMRGGNWFGDRLGPERGGVDRGPGDAPPAPPKN